MTMFMFFRMISGFGVMDQSLSTLTGEPSNSGGAEHCMEMGDGGNVCMFKAFNRNY